MLEAHLRCMVEAYTWYMILVVWYLVEALDIVDILWYMVYGMIETYHE
jgi:hypothetical protein